MNGNLYEDKTASEYLTAGAESELVRINIPARQTLVLTHFANDVDDGRAWGFAQWDILADGVPVRSYTDVRDQYGTANQPREIPFGFIQAKRDLVIIAKNNTTNKNTPPDVNASTFRLLVSIKGAYLDND